VYHRHFQSRNEALAVIRECIEIFYDLMRRDSTLGNTAPSVFAETFCSQGQSFKSALSTTDRTCHVAQERNRDAGDTVGSPSADQFTRLKAGLDYFAIH